MACRGKLDEQRGGLGDAFGAQPVADGDGVPLGGSWGVPGAVERDFAGELVEHRAGGAGGEGGVDAEVGGGPLCAAHAVDGLSVAVGGEGRDAKLLGEGEDGGLGGSGELAAAFDDLAAGDGLVEGAAADAVTRLDDEDGAGARTKELAGGDEAGDSSANDENVGFFVSHFGADYSRRNRMAS